MPIRCSEYLLDDSTFVSVVIEGGAFRPSSFNGVSTDFTKKTSYPLPFHSSQHFQIFRVQCHFILPFSVFRKRVGWSLKVNPCLRIIFRLRLVLYVLISSSPRFLSSQVNRELKKWNCFQSTFHTHSLTLLPLMSNSSVTILSTPASSCTFQHKSTDLLQIPLIRPITEPHDGLSMIDFR